MLLLLQRIFSEVPVLMLLYLIVDPLAIMDASLVSEDFFGRSRILSIRFRLVHCGLLSNDGLQKETFQKVQR